MIDSGASINLIPLSVNRKLGLEDPKTTSIIQRLADKTPKHPHGIVEDMLIKTEDFIFPANFVILDIEEAPQLPVILGQPFLSIGRALLDIETNELISR